MAVRLWVRGSALGSTPVSEVRHPDVQDFADSLIAAGLAPATVSNVLSPIQVFYRREVAARRARDEPGQRGRRARGDQSRPKRIASAGEAAALLGALPAEDRPLWATAFYAGLRRGELQALRSPTWTWARA